MNKIDTIVFDLGGVLIDWNPRYLYKKIFKEEEEMEYFLKEVCSGEWNEMQDGGRSFVEGIALRTKEFPEYENEISAFFDRWPEMLNGAIVETEQILRNLHDSAEVRLYALTNWSSETFPIAWKQFNLLRLFEGILVSGVEKLKKPDPKIYKLLMSRYDILPEKTIFIDDSIRNIKAASDLGFKTIHFIGAHDLQQKLELLI